MQNLIGLPSYDSVAEIIESVNGLVTPSEVHGLLCGIMCASNEPLAGETWAVQAMGLSSENSHFSSAQLNVLKQLLDYTHKRLSTMEFDFRLLLPDESIALADRSSELGNWCHGFLTGLQVSSDQDVINERLSVEGYETITNFAEIAEIDYDSLEYNEEDEMSLMEVTEYIRLGVLMIYSELHKGQQGAAIPSNRTLH